MSNDLLALWAEIEGEPPQPQISARRTYTGAAVACYVGIENPGATRLFFMEGERASFAGLSKLPTCTGFSVTREVPRRGARIRLVARLTDRSAADIFATLAADVLGAASSEALERNAVTSGVQRLDRWLRFLEQHGLAGLSVPAQIGLYGELAFLERYVLPHSGAVAAMGGWMGPLARDQDFQLARASFEVKATVSNPGHIVHISNVRQLDDSTGPTLVLVHVSLEKRAQGRALGELVAAVRNLMGDQVEQLNERLAEAGYLDAHAGLYSEMRFVERTFEFFRVRDDFPRVLERDLRPGVGGVSYDLSLGTCARFALADADVEPLLRAT